MNYNALLPAVIFEFNTCRYGFVLRIVLLLVLAWMSLFFFNSALIVVPISLGRTLFNAIPRLPITHGIKCNGKIVAKLFLHSHFPLFQAENNQFQLFFIDLYAFIIGSYVIWTLLAGARYCIEHVKTGRAKILLTQILKWGSIGLKSSALLSIWVGNFSSWQISLLHRFSFLHVMGTRIFCF